MPGAHNASISSNYSATSSLPAALKRAFVNMGRSLTGQTSTSTTATSTASNTYSATAATPSNGPEQPSVEAAGMTGVFYLRFWDHVEISGVYKLGICMHTY